MPFSNSVDGKFYEGDKWTRTCKWCNELWLEDDLDFSLYMYSVFNWLKTNCICVIGTQRIVDHPVPDGAWHCEGLEWYGENLAVHLFQRPTTNLFRRGRILR